MSEAELHVLRTRMRDGALHKVAKGELRLALPAGLDYDEFARVRITPDEAVAEAIHTVFRYYDQAMRKAARRDLQATKLPVTATYCGVGRRPWHVLASILDQAGRCPRRAE